MKPSLFLLSTFTGLVVCCSAFRSSGVGLLSINALRQTSSHLHMRAKKDIGSDGKKHKSMSPVYHPKTINQKTYCRYLNDPNVSIVLGVGPAGTGKTLFACNAAIQLLKRGDIQKIVITRPVVSVEEDLGFLPGNLVMKMDPWTRPIFDIFLEFYNQKDVDSMVQNGIIEISPLAYMRGRTFKRAFIIADEMQNSSPNQMMMLTTRIGDGSKMVITGDLKQSDRTVENGLLDLMRKLHGYRLYNPDDAEELRIRSVEMEMTDVERSLVVKQVLAVYETLPYRVVSKGGVSDVLSEIADYTSDEETFYESSVSSKNDNDNQSITENNLTEPYNNGAFEMVSYDDAALIPKSHISKHEDYDSFSSGKWSGW